MSLLDGKQELLQEASKSYEENLYSDTFLNHLKLLDGSIELLNSLSKKYSLAIVTGMQPELLKNKVMPMFKVPQVFDEIYTRYDLDDPSRGKPFPDLLIKLLQSLDYQSDHAIMVGDAKGDMQMAQAANITPIAVLTGQLTKAQAQELGVPFIIDKVTDLESVLEQL